MREIFSNNPFLVSSKKHEQHPSPLLMRRISLGINFLGSAIESGWDSYPALPKITFFRFLDPTTGIWSLLSRMPLLLHSTYLVFRSFVRLISFIAPLHLHLMCIRWILWKSLWLTLSILGESCYRRGLVSSLLLELWPGLSPKEFDWLHLTSSFLRYLCLISCQWSLFLICSAPPKKLIVLDMQRDIYWGTKRFPIFRFSISLWGKSSSAAFYKSWCW